MASGRRRRGEVAPTSLQHGRGAAVLGGSREWQLFRLRLRGLLARLALLVLTMLLLLLLLLLLLHVLGEPCEMAPRAAFCWLIADTNL